MYFKARLSKFEFPIDIQEIYPTGRLSKTALALQWNGMAIINSSIS